MAVTEESRNELYNRLQEAIGHGPATTLMESLPPVGWGDVATKQYVATEIALVRKDIEQLRESMATMATKADLAEGLRTQLLAVMGTNLALAGLILGAVKFL